MASLKGKRDSVTCTQQLLESGKRVLRGVGHPSVPQLVGASCSLSSSGGVEPCGSAVPGVGAE